MYSEEVKDILAFTTVWQSAWKQKKNKKRKLRGEGKTPRKDYINMSDVPDSDLQPLSAPTLKIENSANKNKDAPKARYNVDGELLESERESNSFASNTINTNTNENTNTISNSTNIQTTRSNTSDVEMAMPSESGKDEKRQSNPVRLPIVRAIGDYIKPLQEEELSTDGNSLIQVLGDDIFEVCMDLFL